MSKVIKKVGGGLVGGVMGGTLGSVLGSASKKPKSPKAPDPQSIINEQAQANRVNTVSPWGSTKFSQGGDGNWTATTTMSPEMKSIWRRQLAIAGNSGADRTSSPVGRAVPIGVPMREIGGYGGAQYKSLEDALYKRAMSAVKPSFQAQSRAFEQSMADRGMPVGSEAYADQFNLIQDAQNRARNDAALAAVMGSRQAFDVDRAFTHGLNEADRAWALQNQGMALNRDQVNYNQLSSLLAGVQPAPIAPLDVVNPYTMQYQGAMNKYNQQMQSRNDMMGGIMGLGGALGGAAIMASDASLKADIAKIGEVGGLNVYRWSWKPEAAGLDNIGQPYGFIAQEVQQVYPQHVTTRNGYLAIDYSSLMQEIANDA